MDLVEVFSLFARFTMRFLRVDHDSGHHYLGILRRYSQVHELKVFELLFWTIGMPFGHGGDGAREEWSSHIFGLGKI